MADMFADNLIKKCINDIITNRDTIKDDEGIWFNLTKLMFRNFTAIDVFNKVEQALEEVSDEDWFENKYPQEIFQDLEKKRVINKTNSAVRDLINTKLKITDVAKNWYKLDVDKSGKCTCPFHNDSKPSLHFDDKRNIFNCFGCSAKGNLITFIKMMEKTPYGIKNKRS
jgi:hypothetical protein